jgi:hypothetical protein
MKFPPALIAGLLAWLLWSPVQAAQLAVGDAVPELTAKDQRGAEFVFTNGTQFLLVATERACATAANHKLAELGAGFLEKHQAAYLMDIHTMPTVARWFAFPKLKKYPQRIVLVDSAETLASFPAQPGRVTVLALTAAGRIQKISFWNPDSQPVEEFFK